MRDKTSSLGSNITFTLIELLLVVVFITFRATWVLTTFSEADLRQVRVVESALG